MSEETFSSILPQLRQWTDFLYFHLMGEPLCHPHLERFLEIAASHGFKVILTTNGTLLEKRQQLLERLDRYGWDGGWYLRGWYADGTPLGTKDAEECRIALLPQVWGVLCGVNRDRCQIALENVWRMLYERNPGLLKLFTPPFNGRQQPGSIAAYQPGVRENGGQYTHAVPWAVAALHQLGQDERAWELALAVLPVRHAAGRQLALRYRAEPYVLAGDVCSDPQQRGRGGWTWYTGSAAWYLTILTEQLLGMDQTGGSLRLRPVLPAGWDEIRITYRYGNTTYHLCASRSCTAAAADGGLLPEGILRLTDDGRIHEAQFPVR
jgi:cellobiose phosphorylase